MNYLASCIAYNDGKGKFTIQKLPASVQLSSVNAMKFIDVNHDGYPDLIAAGNFFDLLPQFCRLDAGYGHVLLNDKKGNFIEMPISQTGLNLIGQTRDIISVKIKKDDYILFLENNDFPLLYKIQLK